jgi:hypothetical protein
VTSPHEDDVLWAINIDRPNRCDQLALPRVTGGAERPEICTGLLKIAAATIMKRKPRN